VPLPGGGTVRVLDPETSLILFLVHLNKDRFRYLLGFVDVRRVLERESIDWGFVERFLRGEGLLDPACLTLSVVGATLDMQVPVLTTPHGVRRRVWELAWRPSIRLRGYEGRARYRKRQELLPVLARGRLREGLAHWRHVLLPPRALTDAARPGARAPYAWRLGGGRLLNYLARRRQSREPGPKRLVTERSAGPAEGHSST
jgi:hypothetical protein